MQRVGVPKKIINCLFTTLQEAVHRVRTGFGDSKSFYGGKVWLVPIHGIGQGNGAGPAIWAVVSTPLLNVLREKGFGCKVICPLSSSYFRFVGYAIVDDMDVIQSALTDSPESARAQLQHAIDTWEFSLKATCGAFVPEKMVWWLVRFKWSRNSWSYAGIQDSPGELMVNDIENNRKVVKRLEPHQAYETLGVYLAPDGNLNEQFQKMKKAASAWANGLRTGNITKPEVWIALNSTIMRTLIYPLPALRLTRAQCEAILAPILGYCLPALGICRNFTRKLVFLTLDYMGLDIKHLFILQEISRIKDIVFHTFNDTLTGRLYRASMEQFFLEIGIKPTNLTINQYSIIEHLATPSLAKLAMIFLLQYKVILKHPIAFELQRVGDQMIMEALIAMDIPLDELMACNLCRLYMQVCYLSDIVTGDGSELLEEAWQGKPIPYLNRTSAWPTYQRPPMAYWNI